MAKLTAAQIRSIETVLYHLERSMQYVNQPDVAIIRKKAMQTTTLDFEVPNFGAATYVSKEIGSDMAGLEMGIAYLKNFLSFNSNK